MARFLAGRLQVPKGKTTAKDRRGTLPARPACVHRRANCRAPPCLPALVACAPQGLLLNGRGGGTAGSTYPSSASLMRAAGPWRLDTRSAAERICPGADRLGKWLHTPQTSTGLWGTPDSRTPQTILLTNFISVSEDFFHSSGNTPVNVNVDSSSHREKLLSSHSLNQIRTEAVYWFANVIQLTGKL